MHRNDFRWVRFFEDATPDGDAAPADDAVDAAAPEAPAPDQPEAADEPAAADDDSAEDAETPDVEALSDDELSTATTALADEFSALYDAGTPDADALARMTEIAEDIKAIEAEQERRVTARAEAQAAADALRDAITKPADTAATTEPEKELVAASADPPKQTKPRRRGLSASLSSVRQHMPPVEIGEARNGDLVITAAAEVAGVARGGLIDSMDVLASAAIERARVLGDGSGRVLVAQVRRTFEHNIDRTMSAGQVMEVMRAAANPQRLADNLVAAGGWCAPSQPLYSFFNIACDDGMLDLPTIGIDRGGIEWPTSPALSEFLSEVWHWTETDDEAALTGSPTKPCVHVTCPGMNEARLEADGICVEAGFLQEASWPELVANFLSNIMKAHMHVINASHIAQIVSDSVDVTITDEGGGLVAPLLAAIDLQAVDYREKYGMCEDDVLEVVLPRWIKAGFRSDLAYRGGVESFLGVSESDFNAWAASRNVRVQYVTDWQTRNGDIGSDDPATAFPTSVDFLLYAAGTWVRGNGAKIDLGVIRDSTLNATNDYTAAWSEEATLVAQIGHESRVVTVDVCPQGQVGAADISCA